LKQQITFQEEKEPRNQNGKGKGKGRKKGVQSNIIERKSERGVTWEGVFIKLSEEVERRKRGRVQKQRRVYYEKSWRRRWRKNSLVSYVSISILFSYLYIYYLCVLTGERQRRGADKIKCYFVFYRTNRRVVVSLLCLSSLSLSLSLSHLPSLCLFSTVVL
jgi:hypothetical protein